MGRDIHIFMEVDKKGSPPFLDRLLIRPFAQGELFVWKNHEFMNLLAGQGVPRRGFPTSCSSGVFQRYYAPVSGAVEGRDPPIAGNPFLPRHSAWQWPEAEEFVESGESHLPPGNGESRTPEWFSHPNWHSPNWVFGFEFRDAVATVFPTPPVELSAILAALGVFEDECGEARVRFVYWFDN